MNLRSTLEQDFSTPEQEFSTPERVFFNSRTKCSTPDHSRNEKNIKNQKNKGETKGIHLNIEFQTKKSMPVMFD